MIPMKNRRTGVTLLEVIVAATLMILLSLITVESMIIHARTAYANIHQEQVTASARRLIQAITVEMTDYYTKKGERIEAATSSVKHLGDTVTIYRPDGTLVTFRYVQDSGYPGDMSQNKIIRFAGDSRTQFTGTTVAMLVSPDGNKPIFEMVPGVTNLLHVHVRLGDRGGNHAAIDDTATGRGLQTFLIDQMITNQ